MTFSDSKHLQPYKGNHYKHTQDMKYKSGDKQTWMWSTDIKEGNYVPLLIVAGNQKPQLLGFNWLQSIQLDWTKLHQVQGGISLIIIKRFPGVFSRKVGTMKSYRLKADIHLRETGSKTHL